MILQRCSYTFHRLTLDISQQSRKNDSLFDRTKYEKEFFTRLVPACSQRLLQGDMNLDHLDKHQAHECSDFSPSLSNHGLCLTRNAAKLDNVFNPSSHLSSFKSVFRPKHFVERVEMIPDDSKKHYFTFLMDGNSYKDLKRGIEWNITKEATFGITIHEPHDIPDVRGWYNKILLAPAGQITTIEVIHSKLETDESARDIEPSKRKCRFHDENENLISVKWYSKVNCLMDCNMKFAEQLCGCRPWDYPTASEANETSTRICDFFGSTCFNMALEDNVASQCNKECITGCNEINYRFSINREPIDPAKRICELNAIPKTILEREIKNHVLSQFNETNNFVSSTPPGRRVINLLRDVLSNRNVSFHSNAEQAYSSDCKGKLNSDIAVVVVKMGSPKFNKMITNPKVSLLDKLSAFGKHGIQFTSLNKKKLYNVPIIIQTKH